MHCKMAKKLLNWMCTDVQSWFIDAQRDETDLAGGQNFTRITADIHIILLEIFCGNKNLPPYKNVRQIESCIGKTEF